MQMRCPMCGHVFDPAELQCHTACPIGAQCALTCCPQCGYQMPDPERSVSARWLRGLLGRLRLSRPASAPTLVDLPPGRSAVVTDVEEIQGSQLAQLVQMGLLPGAEVRVLRTRPALIVEVDGMTLALDPAAAARIRVAP
jgi:Fe2+ transport system protein FeoA/rubredoxin